MLLLLQCLSDPSGLVKHVGSHLRRGPKREPQGEESHVWKITHLDFTCFRATESQTSGGGVERGRGQGLVVYTKFPDAFLSFQDTFILLILHLTCAKMYS